MASSESSRSCGSCLFVSGAGLAPGTRGAEAAAVIQATIASVVWDIERENKRKRKREERRKGVSIEPTTGSDEDWRVCSCCCSCCVTSGDGGIRGKCMYSSGCRGLGQSVKKVTHAVCVKSDLRRG
jgi:hypothetical protein